MKKKSSKKNEQMTVLRSNKLRKVAYKNNLKESRNKIWLYVEAKTRV